MQTPADSYKTKFRNVLEYIDAHLEEDLTLEGISAVAATSKYHFHRQFAALFGIGIYKYVQLARTKRAAYELAFRDTRILDIALTSGYESHEAFTRAFKSAVGQTPSVFRSAPEWMLLHITQQPLRELRSTHMKPPHQTAQVTIVNFPQTRVAALEHHGSSVTIGNSIRTFIEWRKQNRLPPKLSATFNILHQSSPDTPDADHHFDICAATDRPIEPNAQGVVEKVIPSGRCAVLRHAGSDDTLRDTITYLYATWLPNSGEFPRDYPLFFQRVVFFPDVPEQDAITDVFLPLE